MIYAVHKVKPLAPAGSREEAPWTASRQQVCRPAATLYHTQISDDVGGSLRMPRCPAESGPGDTPSAGLHTAVDSAVCDLYEDDPPAFSDNEEDCRLIRSFDMIFQLHQRSEEIRSRLDHIDRLLLKSRTVSGPGAKTDSHSWKVSSTSRRHAYSLGKTTQSPKFLSGRRR